MTGNVLTDRKDGAEGVNRPHRFRFARHCTILRDKNFRAEYDSESCHREHRNAEEPTNAHIDFPMCCVSVD